MTDRILTPSKITAWLDCAHFLNLQHRVDLGVLMPQRGRFGAMAQLLMDKGLNHETACLAEYRRVGKSVFVVPARDDHESFATWVDRVGNPMADGHDVIYQMPFIHDGVRGIADFLIRVDHDAGPSTYEPVDAKLARTAAKPGHVLQLCFYAEAIEAMTGVTPVHAHIWLGSGREETFRLADVRAYWRRLRGQLVDVMQRDVDESTRPEKCAHCDFCEFADHCQTQWREEDSLTFIAGIRPAEKITLETAGVPTIAALAVLDHPVENLDDVRSERLTLQAALQLQAKSLPEEAPPPFILLARGDPKAALLGFAAMPEPDEGDVFLDYEGDPFWRADRGLFFLFGLLTRGANGEQVYEARWAHDIHEESAETLSLIQYFARRRETYPGMHVYHYNHTERSALEGLAALHSVGEDALDELVDSGMFIDLLKIVRESLQAGVESYGLKNIERLTGYERNHDIEQGAGAVVEYEEYMADGDLTRLDRIAVYNRDDVRATHALHEWLVDQRADDLPWRPAFVEPPESPFAEINAQVIALHAFEPGTVEHLLGDVLGYWRREGRVEMAHLLGKLGSDSVDQLRDQDVLSGLQWTGQAQRLGANDKVLMPGLGFTYPVQPVALQYGAGKASVMYSTGDGPPGYAGVESLDTSTRSFTMTLSQKYLDLGVIPSAVVLKDTFNNKPKLDALSVLASEVLDADSTGSVPRVGLALLRNDPPIFADGHGPKDATFSDDLASILAWAPHLQHSVVAIQGPPGTGKTFTGAHIVLELVRQNKRVGMTAMSHSAINNLLREVVKVFTQAGELGRLRAIRRGPDKVVSGLDSIAFATANAPCASVDYNVVAGTSWLFAGQDMRDSPVDVLLIDEAGQLALADALASSMSTNSMLLLGDPAQLAQVSEAIHPDHSGASVLEHVLGDSVTIPDDRGVFLAATRRMHPDVCGFISEQVYEGRLFSHPSCAAQTTDFGTGLRWLRAHHHGCSTSSTEEAALVRDAIAAQHGYSWTDSGGVSHRLSAADYLVVAPYNDQVAELRKILDSDDRTRGVRAGTVDKFQGQEAPVVFFTMTTSADADMPRGADFLFSKNRLNVAISRARCLAYLVCTDELLNTRARDVREMKLISTLCAFVEQATPIHIDVTN